MKKILILINILFVYALFAGPSATLQEYQKYMQNMTKGGGRQDRPSRDHVYDTEHFRVWYNTEGIDSVYSDDFAPANGVPDYIDSTAVYLEYAYYVLVDSIGFRPPLPDSTPPGRVLSGVGGDNRHDVYLGWMGNGYYGSASFDTFVDSAGYHFVTGYSTINSRLKSIQGYEDNPYPALAVTCAHEFMHLIQFHYSRDYGDLLWQMESFAVLTEELVFDDANDYYLYLPYFANTEPLMSTRASFHEYGSSVFMIFLYERFGLEFLKRLWENTMTYDTEAALAYTIEEYGSTLDDEYILFVRWVLRTGSRSVDGYGFTEGENYNVGEYKDTSNISIAYIPDSQAGPYSTSIYRLALDYEYNGTSISTELDADPDSYWAFNVLANYPEGSDFGDDNVLLIDDLDYQVDDIWNYDTIFFAQSLLNYRDIYEAEYVLNIEFTNGSSTPKPVIEAPYPNPVDRGSIVKFPYVSYEEGDVLVLIYDSAGKLLMEQEIESELGSHLTNNVPFISTENLVSGIYFAKIIVPGLEEKFVFIVK